MITCVYVGDEVVARDGTAGSGRALDGRNLVDPVVLRDQSGEV